MALVDTNIDMPNLNLRVYKRSGKILCLLWRRLPEIADKTPKIVVQSLDDKRQQIQITEFVLDPQNRSDLGERLQIDANMVICVIHEAKNGMDTNQNYYLTVDYGNEMLSQGIKVQRAGVLPDHEKEDRERNEHNYLWDPKSQLWRKQCGVMSNNHFYAGVVQVPCPSCGYKGEGSM